MRQLAPVAALLLLNLPVSGGVAEAAVACKPRAALSKNAQECADNEVYADAAVLCLEELEALVQKEKVRVQKAMAAANEKNVSDQNKKQATAFKGAIEVAQLSVKSLEELIRNAELVRKSVDEYKGEMLVPDSFYLIETEGGSPEEYLESEPCFIDTRKVIRSVIEDVGGIIEDLTKAKAESEKILAGAQAGEARLDAGSAPAGAAAPVKRTQGKGAPSAKAKGKKHRKQESTITGDIEGQSLPEPAKPAKK